VLSFFARNLCDEFQKKSYTLKQFFLCAAAQKPVFNLIGQCDVECNTFDSSNMKKACGLCLTLALGDKDQGLSILPFAE